MRPRGSLWARVKQRPSRGRPGSWGHSDHQPPPAQASLLRGRGALGAATPPGEPGTVRRGPRVRDEVGLSATPWAWRGGRHLHPRYMPLSAHPTSPHAAGRRGNSLLVTDHRHMKQNQLAARSACRPQDSPWRADTRAASWLPPASDTEQLSPLCASVSHVHRGAANWTPQGSPEDSVSQRCNPLESGGLRDRSPY